MQQHQESPTDAEKQAKSLARTQRITWLFGYFIPLYAVLFTLIVIAIPKEVWTMAQRPPITPAPLIGRAAQEMTTADIAKLAMDAGKERIDGVRESNDKLFSLIAAMAALLVFFGFKGLETFNAAKDRAELAVKNAEKAHRTASASIEKFNNFVEIQYSRNIVAEIYVVQGMILLEMAELYKKVLKKCNIADEAIKKDYDAYLKYGLFFLDKVTQDPDGIDKKIVCRALIMQGYLHKRLGDLGRALYVVTQAYTNDDQNDSAYFNAACYCCLLAASEMSMESHDGTLRYEEESLLHLAKAIELKENSRGKARRDEDFLHFVTNRHEVFLKMVAMPMPNGEGRA